MVHGGNPPAENGTSAMPAMPAMPNIMGSSNNSKNNSPSIFNLGGNNAKNGNGIMASVTNAMNGMTNLYKNIKVNTQ